MAHRIGLVLNATHHVLIDQRVQPTSEHVSTDAQCCLEIVEAASAETCLPNQNEVPVVAKHRSAAGNGAGPVGRVSSLNALTLADQLHNDTLMNSANDQHGGALDQTELFRKLSATASFNEWAQFDVERVVEGECDLRMVWRSNDMGQYAGFLHAGVIAALLDTACGFAAAASAGSVLSSHFSMNCLAPAIGESFLATGRVIKAGRSQIFCSGELRAVRGDHTKLVATANTILVPSNVPIALPGSPTATPSA